MKSTSSELHFLFSFFPFLFLFLHFCSRTHHKPSPCWIHGPNPFPLPLLPTPPPNYNTYNPSPSDKTPLANVPSTHTSYTCNIPFLSSRKRNPYSRSIDYWPRRRIGRWRRSHRSRDRFEGCRSRCGRLRMRGWGGWR